MTSKTRYRHRVQCVRTRDCGTRFTLKLHPSKYKHSVKCPDCGSKVYSIEKARRNELAKQTRCYCDGYPFPHKVGSLRMCREHPLAGTEPTGDEIRAYYGCLETPRSG